MEQRMVVMTFTAEMRPMGGIDLYQLYIWTLLSSLSLPCTSRQCCNLGIDNAIQFPSLLTLSGIKEGEALQTLL